MTNKPVRTRLAPSPTGMLHIGTLRTALYCFLLARKHNGQFILRIEDTDQKREVEGATENLINTLKNYGLNFDEGPTIGGPHAPYIQTQRLDIYAPIVENLIQEGHAYRCFCTSEELEAMREEQKLLKKPPMYDRRCRHLKPEEIQANLDANKPYVVRQAIQLNRTVEFIDSVRGRMKFDTNTLDDHVLVKTNGVPTYHLAAIVDDWKMETSHIMRGEEWLPSTPKHILLFEALGAEHPQYVHMPLILNPDGTKLSKRKSDVSASSYLEKGYDIDALINFIALLGWNPGNDQEIMSMDELIQNFSLEKLQKSGSIFDLDKLNWFNWQWRRRKFLANLQQVAKEIDSSVEITEPKKGHLQFQFSNNDLLRNFNLQKGKLLSTYLLPEDLKELSSNNSEEFLFLTLSTLEEKILKEPKSILENHSIYTKKFSPENFDPQMFQHEKMKIDKEMANQAIQTTIQQLAPSTFDNPEDIKQNFIQIIKNLDVKNGQVLWPVRVALSNSMFSPGVFDMAYAIGYQETISRLEKALQALS